MTCEEACRNIVKARYGLQGIYEDYPEECPERWKAERDYWRTIVNRDLECAWEAIKDLEEVRKIEFPQ